MSHARPIISNAAVVLFAAVLAFVAPAASAQTWKPSRNVEIVVPFAAGGGNDVLGRIIQKIIIDNRMLDVSSSVVNKPGGGGAVGLMYLNQHAGDGNYLSIISTSTLTSYIIGTGTVNYTDLTPIASLITEYIAFAVKADSPIKTFADLVQRMKANPESTSFAVGGGLGNPNHVAMAAALKAAGVNVRSMKAVAFGGGKEALTAVMGGHVDVLAAAASILANQVKAGKLRLLGVAAPARLTGTLAEVPTMKEQGVNLVFGFSRYIVGPKGLSPSQTEYWNGVIGKVLETEAWKNTAAQHHWVTDFASSAKTIKDLHEQYGQLREVLSDLGMAKKRAGEK